MALGAGLGLALNWAGGQGMVDADIVGNVALVGKEIGDLFLRLLQMLVVPLIVSSLITGVTSMGDLRTLGSIGGRAIGFGNHAICACARSIAPPIVSRARPLPIASVPSINRRAANPSADCRTNASRVGDTDVGSDP